MEDKPLAERPPDALQKDRRHRSMTPAELKALGKPEQRSNLDLDFMKLFWRYKRCKGTELGERILATTSKKTQELPWWILFNVLGEVLKFKNPPHKDSLMVLLKRFAEKSGAISLELLFGFFIKEKNKTLHQFFKIAIRRRVAEKNTQFNLKALAYAYGTTLFLENSLTGHSKEDPRFKFFREMTRGETK